ncbi:MAG: chromate efflux transporter [Myxococcaceae bacterium]
MSTSLGELALLFGRLGFTAFGGPAVHVSMMQEEVVRRRGWLTDERFLDFVGATNLIPGPNSTELALHIGWERRGLAGLLVAGFCFIGPAVLLTGALAFIYLRYGGLPAVGWLLDGVKPAMLVVVAQALLALGRRAMKTPFLILLAAASVSAVMLGAVEWMVLLGAGLLAVAVSRARLGEVAPMVPLAVVGAPAVTAGAVSSASIFWVFLKTGSMLFGSGYVLLAFMRTELVQQRHWLTEAQLLDAIAAGQLTPGPVFSTATFAGYLLSGPAGAAAATVGIFLPAFVLVALSGPLVPKLRASKAAGAVLDAVNAASLALMGVVTLDLGRAALGTPSQWLIFAASAVLALRFGWGSTVLLALGAVGSVLLHLAA